MSNSSEQTFHPLIQELLNDFGAIDGNLRLEDADLARWYQTLKAHEAHPRLAAELIVLAMRLQQHGVRDAVLQLVVLCALLVGESRTEAMLEEAGVVSTDARKLVNEAKGSKDPLASGLAPRGGGFSLRKRS